MILYRYFIRRRNSLRTRKPVSRIRRGSTWDEKKYLDSRRTVDHNVPSGEEDLESNSLSASKGYGFGLGIRRGFPFAYRKSKSKSNSSKSGQRTRRESHLMSPQYDHDDKRFSLSTLAYEIPVLPYVPESEKLAPGWTNPCDTRTNTGRVRLAPELQAQGVGANDADDDAKTLTSRQGEAIAATLSLSPRTSEAPFAYFPPSGPKVPGNREPRPLERVDSFLQVRETSPFRLDVGAIFTSLKGKRDSRSTSGSAGSSWSKVRDRLYRKAHKDDGRQSSQAHGVESSSSSGPESVPVVMHKSGSDAPPSDTAPVSGTYSFLDFTSSHPSFRRSKANTANTVSSAPAETGHEKDASGWNDNTSIRMVRIERNGADRVVPLPKPDAPSTPSRGSNTVSPSHHSDGQGSAPFPFLITIPPSVHLPHPFNAICSEEGQPTSPTVPSTLDESGERPQVLVDPPPSPSPDPHSPTDSIPFTVSDLHFRHSFSDYATIDSRRTSANSGLPPHPPLPHRSNTTLMPYSVPPPYIVQRVLGMVPLSPSTPAARIAGQYPSSSAALRTSSARNLPTRPETAPSSARPLRSALRVGGIIGPRPRPSTSASASLQSRSRFQSGREGQR